MFVFFESKLLLFLFLIFFKNSNIKIFVYLNLLVACSLLYSLTVLMCMNMQMCLVVCAPCDELLYFYFSCHQKNVDKLTYIKTHIHHCAKWLFVCIFIMYGVWSKNNWNLRFLKKIFLHSFTLMLSSFK